MKIVDWSPYIGKKLNKGAGAIEILGLTTKSYSTCTRTAFEAKCFCGNLFIIACSYFINKASKSAKSCGCYKKQQTSLTKEEIEILLPVNCKLTPIKPSNYYTNKGLNKWEWKCICGNVYYSHPTAILRSKIKSCGCSKLKKEVSYYNNILMSLGSIHKVISLNTSYKKYGAKVAWLDTIQCGNCLKVSQKSISGLISSIKRNPNSIGIYCISCNPSASQFPNYKLSLLRKMQGIWPKCYIRATNGILAKQKRNIACELCGIITNTITHHITPHNKFIASKYYLTVKDKYKFHKNIINHSRNLIHICNNCHKSVHSINNKIVDKTLTNIFKAIKKFSF